MVNTQQFPKSLIDVIREQKNISKIFYCSKGSSEYLYIITYEQDNKEIFNVVVYGEARIKDYLKDFYSKSVEQLSYSEGRSFERLIFYIEKLFSDYDLDSIEIDGNKMSLGDDIEGFLKSIS